MNDRITVDITCYSGSNDAFLSETIASIRAQGIEPNAVKDERNTAVKWDESIQNCTKEYLHQAHHDDVYMPGFYKESIAYLDAHPEAAACFTLDYIIDGKGRRKGHTALPFPPLDAYTFEFLFDAMGKYGNFLRCPSVVLRVAKVRGLKYPIEECFTANDTGMWFQILAKAGPIGIIPKPLYLYREHSQSDTQKNVMGGISAYDHILAMEYATKLKPEVKTYLAHIAIAKGKKEREDAVDKRRIGLRTESAKSCRFLVCHESPGNAGTGVLVLARCREFNKLPGEDITYYVYPGEVTRREYDKGCPTIQIPPLQFFKLCTEFKPTAIEYHHLLRWPCDILDVPAPEKTVYLHDSYLWCAAYHSFNGKKVCNEPEENKCKACIGISTSDYRKKNAYLKRVLPTMKVYANSEYTAMYAGLHLGCKVQVHKFEVPDLDKPFKGKKVGYFGGWYAVKGVDTLMEVARHMPEVQFLLFTDPPGGMVNGRGIYGYDNIMVMGGYRRMDLPYCSNLVDAVIVPSKNESYGLVAREMRLLGLPVVCSRVGGLDGSVDSDDVQGFVNALREVL